jgi:ABC-type branched-subunit amino acid transport system substrate-binding protein
MMAIAAGGRRVALAALLMALGVGVFHPAAALDAAEARGKQIYRQGTSPDGGTINAMVGEEGVTLPAAAVPCTGCHGYDGLGRDEGGLLPPDIRWSQLTKTYGHVHDNGRRHPAFDETSVARLLRTGLDPADNRLGHAMPLYEMSEKDVADLVAYLQYLERDRDPGVEDDRIQVGTLLPLRGSRGRLGQAMAQVMHAHFQDVNAAGGVYGRRIELLTVAYGVSPEATLKNLRAAFQAEGIFALVGAYTVELDDELLELLRDDGMPLVGPFTLDPGDALIDGAAFYMYPGFDEQVRVLTDQALAEGAAKETPVAIAGPKGNRVDRLVESVRAQLGSRKAVEPVEMRYAAGEFDAEAMALQVSESGSEAVFFFGAQDRLHALLGALAARNQKPRIYVLSSFVSRTLLEAPPSFHYRIFIAYPTHTSDISAKGRAAYQDLAQRHALPRDHIQAQIAAFAAAKLLVEGLRRAGRDLSRTRLVEGLEDLYAYKTELTPPLTYGPNRRIGARGAHVVAVDLMKKIYEPVGGWQELR